MQHSVGVVYVRPAVGFLLPEQAQQQRRALGLRDGRVWRQSRRVYNKATVVSARTTELVLDISPLLPMLFTRTWRHYVRVFAIANLSVICNASAPYSGVESFGDISSPFATLAILWPLHKILRSSQVNRFIGGVKRKRGSKIERWWTHQRLCLISVSRSGVSSPDEFFVLMLLHMCW